MHLNDHALAWKDDADLLYFARTEEDGKYGLKKWNISSGTSEDCRDLAGRKIVTEVSPISMVINEAGSILAIYGISASQNEPSYVIQFIQLETGEDHILHPWTNKVDDERLDFNWYGASDQGVMLYSSRSLLKSQLAWLPD